MSKPQPWSIVVVDDNAAIILPLQAKLREWARSRNWPGDVGIVASHTQLNLRLEQQIQAQIEFQQRYKMSIKVELVILDWAVQNRSITNYIHYLRAGTTENIHPALSPTATVVGYSGHEEAAGHFRACGLDGFILKTHRDSILGKIESIMEARQAGQWREFME